MGDMQLKCPSCCDKIFESKPALVEHLANILDNIVCPICNNKWSSLGQLIEHLSLDNCQSESTLQNLDLKPEPEPSNVERHNIIEPTLEELEEENIQTESNGQKDLADPFSPSIKDTTEEGSEMGRMYVEFLSKQLTKPCLQTQELKLVKDGDVSRYVLVTSENANSTEELDHGSTVVTKQNNDGTISLTTVEEMEFINTGPDSLEVTEEDDQEIYSCNTCKVSFTSVLEHIQNYHNDQDVVVEEPVDVMNSTDNEMPMEQFEDPLGGAPEDITADKQASRRVITETGDIVETPMLVHNSSVTLAQSEPGKDPEPQIKQETVSRSDRKYLVGDRVESEDRLVVDSVIKEIEQPEEGTKELYHKVVIKQMETTSGEKLKIFHCKCCNTYVSNLEEFKSRPCKQLKYTCPHCPVVYQNHRSLCAHMKVHKIRPDFGLFIQDPPNYECEVCNTKFQTHKSLKLHKRMHDPIKARPILPPVEGLNGGKASQDQFLCAVCNKLIPMDYRPIHVASHKANRQEFHCDICNKMFHSRSYLEMHMSVHSAEKARVDNQDKSLQYQCLYCNRRFARPHEKVKHERIHTGEKPHSCEICGKSFRVSYCLTLHMRTHTGARPYECTHCGKRFKAHSVYNHHLLTHSDVRAYKCTYCPKAFKTSVQLAGHKNSHTKPFSCKHCNRPFASLYAVRVHTETHNRQNNLKFACHLCGASYARAFALKDHMNQAHDPDSEKAELKNTLEKDGEWVSSDVINMADTTPMKSLPHEVDITDLAVKISSDITVP